MLKVSKAKNQRPIEQMAQALGVPPWLFLAACRANKWAKGRLMSEATFKKGIEVVASRPANGPKPKKVKGKS